MDFCYEKSTLAVKALKVWQKI